MGKRKPSGGLGSAIIRNRFGGNKRQDKESFLHTSELNDGYDWGRLNLQSVTEQSNLDDFLTTAELAGTEFIAEKLNVSIVTDKQGIGLLSKADELLVKQAQNENRALLSIPRRPQWDRNTSAEELDQMERTSFLEWRRKLAELQEHEHLVLTPFEKNLDFWRQLWRVIEKSDVVVQIVDARNPLLFYCEDVFSYVKEVDESKANVILVNKADLLSEEQRIFWANHFQENGINFAFWSAFIETERLKPNKEEEITEVENYESSEESEDEEMSSDDTTEVEHNKLEASTVQAPTVEDSEMHEACSKEKAKHDLLDGEELIEFFKSFQDSEKCVTDGITTIGLIGYPNVGKSSTINAILQCKKVPVSATPGRTKHFQTLFVDKSVMLCDCPGLVMPTFVSTKADMVISGILPIDQMRDYVPPISLVCQHIYRDVFEATYGIIIPRPTEDEDPNRVPTALELLGAYACMRGFMTHKGVPDYPRAARCILKHYMNGKLLYCHPPPEISVDEFKCCADSKKERKIRKSDLEGPSGMAPRTKIDQQFFSKNESKMNFNGRHGGSLFARKERSANQPSVSEASGSMSGSQASLNQKPWKRHGNAKKKKVPTATLR